MYCAKPEYFLPASLQKPVNLHMRRWKRTSYAQYGRLF
jgi:hypothetical protein